jgi:hypothetical protein
VEFCVSELQVMAFTSGDNHAGSNTGHKIKMVTTAGAHYVADLYNRPGDDMLPNKGDLWTLTLSSFGIDSSTCLNPILDIFSLYVLAGGDDGWKIESIVIVYHTTVGGYFLLTADYDINKWVDGDGGPSQILLTRAF